MTTFGKVIRHYRQDRALTLDELAASAHLDATEVSALEYNRRVPPDGMLLPLATALDLPPVYLWLCAGRLPPEFADLVRRCERYEVMEAWARFLAELRRAEKRPV